MPLANYYTEVSAIKSIGEIQGMLVAHKAKAILTNYDGEGQPESLSFIVPTRHGDIPFHLPANIKKVEAILLSQRARKPETWQADYQRIMSRIHEQAFRVGWRNIKDWVRAQMAFIETEMVTIEQVFLPYMEDKNGKMLYEAMEEKKFYLGPGGSPLPLREGGEVIGGK